MGMVSSQKLIGRKGLENIEAGDGKLTKLIEHKGLENIDVGDGKLTKTNWTEEIREH